MWCVQTHNVMVLRSTHAISKINPLVLWSHVDFGPSLRRFFLRSGSVLMLLRLCSVGVVDLVRPWPFGSELLKLYVVFGGDEVDLLGGDLCALRRLCAGVASWRVAVLGCGVCLCVVVRRAATLSVSAAAGPAAGGLIVPPTRPTSVHLIEHMVSMT